MVNKADKGLIENKRFGFSLVEILISILIVGGILTTMYSGFSTSNNLIIQASFESEAAFMAEREIEYLKSELIAGSIKPHQTAASSKFKMGPGWKILSLVEPDKIAGSYKILVKVENNNKKFTLESFIYLPNTGENLNEG